MPEITVVHIALLVAAMLVGIILGWVIRGKRSRHEKAAVNAEPHLMVHYLRELANQFHAYYNAHQFIVDDAAIRNARLNLISATSQVIHNGLKLLGVSAPESM